MAAIERTAAILLAAGRSRRFGPEDKLLSVWRGRPLVAHAAAALASLPFGTKIALVSDGSGAAADLLRTMRFEIVINAEPGRGMGHSLALGIAAVGQAEAALVALGDMPCVPAAHHTALCDATADATPAAASFGLGRPTVPAAFSRILFPRLAALDGDHGARDLLFDAVWVPIDPALLMDIDTPAGASLDGTPPNA